MLQDHPMPLTDTYDLVALDLDGVVYVGGEAVPGAPEHLARAAEAGAHLAFVTNNAARPPATVAAHLRDLGVDAGDEDVVTSAQAAARMLRGTLDEGARVFLIGGEGLDLALREQDLVPVTDPEDGPVAVVQGYGPDMAWKRVVTGAVLVREGLPWVASNTDMTLPTQRGPGPGNGALVRLVAEFAEREPEVAGKPEPALLEETLLRTGGERPLMVGDRLDTDIAGAHRVGWDSLLVLTGVTDLAAAVAASEDERPSYVARDLAGLTGAHPAPTLEDGRAELGGWTARVEQGSLVVQGSGKADDWYRAVLSAAWDHADRHGSPPDATALDEPTSVG